MIIFLGSDHRGFALKEMVKGWLLKENHQVKDLGNLALDPEDDYPDFAFAVAEKVSESDENKGIVFCGSGVGMDITANRLKNIRCALAFNRTQIESATRDDHVNMLAIPSDYLTESATKEIILAWLLTPFGNEERFIRRIKKIDKKT